MAGLENLFALGRKSIPDLVACCASDDRARLERELHRLRGLRFKRLRVVGTEADILSARYRSRIAPALVLGSLAAFKVRYDVPVAFSASPSLATRLPGGRRVARAYRPL